MLTPTILFRQTDWTDAPELAAIVASNLRVCTTRAVIPKDSLVIPRYSALPFYKELEEDVKNLGSKLINSFSQHLYVADLRRWYEDFKDITPKTYFSLREATVASCSGPFVLKGSTNSKKFSWKTHMFAQDKTAMAEVYSRLQEDGLIGTQDIVIRDYVPLRNHGYMPTGLPISHEFRCFFYKDKMFAKGFYWSNEAEPEDNVPQEFLDKVGRLGSPNINFWVADVAQTEKGDWIVIELNDGSMSGLSAIDPNLFYNTLRDVVSSDL